LTNLCSEGRLGAPAEFARQERSIEHAVPQVDDRGFPTSGPDAQTLPPRLSEAQKAVHTSNLASLGGDFDLPLAWTSVRDDPCGR